MPMVMHATLLNVDFSYGDPGSTQVIGDFSLDATLIAPDEYLATSGFLTLSGAGLSAYALTPGAYALIPNPTPPGESYSPDGAFIFDDLGMPNADPVVTNGGLLAGGPGGVEINLFSNGPDNYQFYVSNGANQTFTVPTTGSISVSVPDGGMTLTLLGVALAALAFFFRRKAITCLIA